MPVALLSSKLHTPRLRPNAVLRARLTQALRAGLDCPGAFGLISAPAGFGKTTLLTEFVAEYGAPVAWLSLDDGDNDPGRFWSYVIAACQGLQPGLGDTALALLQVPQALPDETIPTILINELAGSDRSIVLVLDDYHVIQNRSIHAALSFLLDHLPNALRLVISTRVDPPWPLARFRVRGQLAEIRALDLRFHADEIDAFLNQVMELDIPAADIAALEARTEGWIASLQLAAISLKGRSDVSAFIRAFTGSHAYVAEYLVQEVLQRQGEEVRDFLLRTSILDRMCAPLCEAVSGQPDGSARLKEIDKANLFLVPLDDDGEWYRYHQLFADLLRARLRQSESSAAVSALHRSAADWFEQAGMIPEAIDHALAIPDYARAAQLIGQVALSTMMQAHVRTLEGWLQAIPAEYAAQNPHIGMTFAWLHLLRSSLQGAQPYLDRLARDFSSAGASDDPLLQGEWLAIQSKACGLQGRPAESRQFAESALQILPETELHVRSMVELNLATVCEQLLDFGEAARIYRAIVQRARAIGDATTEILGASAEARMLLQQGRLHAAVDVAREAVQRLEASGRMSPFGATLYGELGQIYYFWHQLDEARQYMERSARTSGLGGYSDSEIYLHLTLSKMRQMEGDWTAADAEMRAANDIARRSPPAMVQEQIVAQQARVDLALGRISTAEAALQPYGFRFAPAFDCPAVPQGATMTLPLALLYNSALRVVSCRVAGEGLADRRAALDVAGTLLEQELGHAHLPAALETLLLRGQLRDSLGDHHAALRDVAQALDLAEPEGFISPFVEEGQPVASALEQLRTQAGISRAFVERILDCFSRVARPAPEAPDPMRALIDPLTPRELEVLHLIAAGDSNQAIAGRLVITLSAVKKHTGNIFRKLNVNSRTQALVRARELGLLSTRT